MRTFQTNNLDNCMGVRVGIWIACQASGQHTGQCEIVIKSTWRSSTWRRSTWGISTGNQHSDPLLHFADVRCNQTLEMYCHRKF